MEQPAGAAAGPKRKIVLLGQADPQAAHGCVTGHSCPDDATANNQQIQSVFDKA